MKAIPDKDQITQTYIEILDAFTEFTNRLEQGVSCPSEVEVLQAAAYRLLSLHYFEWDELSPFQRKEALSTCTDDGDPESFIYELDQRGHVLGKRGIMELGMNKLWN